MKIYKQFYMIFVLMRACLWTVSDTFASTDNTDAAADHIIRDDDANDDIISLANRRILYMANDNAVHQDDFSGTQVSQDLALPVFHRDREYNSKGLNGERARFLRLLLFPNHSFG